MTYAVAIEIIIDVPEAHNFLEAELYGKNYADKFRESAEDPLIDCAFKEVVEYEVEE